ncbi:MAG TPA: hypothetical protein DEB06_01890, partial [Phycisphaerales bacterium]|nr:hypothetical protein [Phycisphaerales bacterium]
MLVILALAVAACDSTPKRTPRARTPDIKAVRDTPSVLRNTIMAQSSLRGMEPVLVSGYGLVVGLDGTGSRDVPGPVRAVMEREMLALGVGREVGPFARLTPNELLDDPNTAVVIVSAIIPIGAPAGTRFDVQIDTLPGTSTTSLEGGTLYTTNLYRGLVRPASPATTALASARGPLFINPFASPERGALDSVRRTQGRVLDGGWVIEPQPVFISLDAPSHTRARAMAEAINSRFPQQSGRAPVARGRNEELVELTVPPEFRDDPDEFTSLIRYLRTEITFPEQAAVEYARALKEQPALSESLAWALQALGPIAIPAVRGLYEYPETRPRLAALTAGAKLGDLLVRPHLEDLALSGPPGLRPSAIALLAVLGEDPKINLFLRDLLNDPDVGVRVSAYEALDRRNDPSIERRTVPGKFTIDSVPSAEPMVYVTMQRAPKVVLFGSPLTLRRPVYVEAWNGRLMLTADSPEQPRVKVYYKDPRSEQGSSGEVRPELVELVEYMAHKTTPEEPAPGLDFSYSEVVGALAALLAKGGAAAAFVPETDRLALALLRSRQTEMGEDRPEVSDEGPAPDAAYQEKSADWPGSAPAPSAATASAGEDDRPEGPAPSTATGPAAAPTTKRKYVVPLQPQKA